MLKFNEDFIKNCDEESDKGYILAVDVKYLKRIYNIHCDSPFLPERIKIYKCNCLICNLHDKSNYVVHIRALKEALDHGIILNKVYKAIQFNQEAWLKEYFDMNTKLRTEAKIKF